MVKYCCRVVKSEEHNQLLNTELCLKSTFGPTFSKTQFTFGASADFQVIWDDALSNETCFTYIVATWI
jgi:hypothetical protein